MKSLQVLVLNTNYSIVRKTKKNKQTKKTTKTKQKQKKKHNKIKQKQPTNQKQRSAYPFIIIHNSQVSVANIVRVGIII